MHDPGFMKRISQYIIFDVNVLIVGEARQEGDASLRLIDIGVILKGSSFWLKNVSYSSEELSLVSMIFRILFALFFYKSYFIFYENSGDCNSCNFTKSDL